MNDMGAKTDQIKELQERVAILERRLTRIQELTKSRIRKDLSDLIHEIASGDQDDDL